jgi:hypothetical protein
MSLEHYSTRKLLARVLALAIILPYRGFQSLLDIKQFAVCHNFGFQGRIQAYL